MVVEEDAVTSSAWPSAALRFFFEDSPVEKTDYKKMVL
jgi:hypothetical protein